jgi:hypothetical protein
MEHTMNDHLIERRIVTDAWCDRFLEKRALTSGEILSLVGKNSSYFRNLAQQILHKEIDLVAMENKIRVQNLEKMNIHINEILEALNSNKKCESFEINRIIEKKKNHWIHVS